MDTQIVYERAKAVADDLLQQMADYKAQLVAALAPVPADVEPTEAQPVKIRPVEFLRIQKIRPVEFLTFADYEALIGQVVTAQRLYELQREAARLSTNYSCRHDRRTEAQSR